MRETEEAYRKQQEKKKTEKKPDDVMINRNQERVHTAPAPPKTETPPETPEKKPAEAPKANEDNNDLKEALAYIESGNEVNDEENGKVWIGRRQEYYNDDNGKPLTKDELIAMAKEDPATFMHDVKEHLQSLKSENNGE